MTEYPTGCTLSKLIPGLDTAELVNRGGQKAVYRATIKGQEVALKVIRLTANEEVDEESVTEINSIAERAQREVDILEQVDVPVLAGRGPLGLSTVEIDDTQWMYFTEEWIEGETLSKKIRKGNLPPASVASLGVDLIQAACWLSCQGLVHRDIKPANVMWAVDRSRFVLLDPGIALDLYGPSLTQAHQLVGTIAYLSPEQMDPYQKRRLDFRSDLFSIGVVLYEAATGQHPFIETGTTQHQLLAAIRTVTPQPVADRVAGFPRALGDVIARLLGKQPHLRYRRCGFALSAIEQIEASLESVS